MSAKPAWMNTSPGLWIKGGLLTRAIDLRAEAVRARKRFSKPSETANIYREPANWGADVLDELAGLLEQRAAEIPTPVRAPEDER